MHGLQGCTPEQLASFAEWVGRLKHDLGKYIWFRQGWLPDTATLEERRAAVIADVQHTRRGPEGSVDAQTVWQEFRPVLLGEQALHGHVYRWRDPRIRELDEAMTELATLDLHTTPRAGLVRASTLCESVAGIVRALAADARVASRPPLNEPG